VASVGLRERARYWFDNTMSRGTPALIACLGLALVGLIAVTTGLVWIFVPDEAQRNPLTVAWESLLRTLDPGTMGNDAGSPQFLGLMLFVTIGGIFVVSALIGILAAGLNDKLATLRKGRSRVVESGHTVILGWSDQVFTIVAELVRAADSSRSCVVILADRDKVVMEEALRSRLHHHFGRLRVVCRSGDPTLYTDLELVRPDAASTIVVPIPEADEPDVTVIKTLLALRNRTWSSRRPNIVAAVADSHNAPAACLAGGPAAQVIDAKEIIARLIVQSRRQPGLSAVWTDLLGFDGDEVYMRPEPGLVGSTYAQALLAYEKSAVIGLLHADGAVDLNPPSQTSILPDDELILLAHSKSDIRLATRPAPVDEEALSAVPHRPQPVEDTLVLGWNDRGPTILRLLDRYLPDKSTVEIAAAGADGGVLAAIGQLSHLKVTATPCQPTERPDLEALDPSRFEHVILLADDTAASPDSRTLVTLLHLRDMKECNGHGYSIVSELNDDANRRLAQVTKADDFVIGRKLISLYLTQLSQNPHLDQVFAELFDAHGSDIYLTPADEYVRPGAEVTFATVIEAAHRRGETAIGFRRQNEAYEAPTYGVVLNPPKSEPITLAVGDRVVVLARV
jgi:voltage-gated potassium channel Kch